MKKTIERYISLNQRQIALAVVLVLLVALSSSARPIGIWERYKVRYSGSVTATAYNSLVGQTDDTPWITASGTRCRPGVIASNFLPIGSKVLIEGFGDRVFVVEDRMNERYAKRLDIWMSDYGQAIQFGRRTVRYLILG
ncbi:MAG: 3D domain-containing protein [bacterium]